MNPKVTIIMATFNRAHFIEETLLSVQNQTFVDWECLIIDDGGSDNTIEIIAPILKKDDRFRFFKRTGKYKKGLPGCRNYGLDLAKGYYIIFFDDDDIVHPNNLKIGVEVLEMHNVDFCHYQKLSFVRQKPLIQNSLIKVQQYLTKDDLEKVITQKIGLASCTVLWSKKCFDKTRFNERLLYAEEWECYSRLLSEDFRGIIISNILYYNRKHADSNTGEFHRNNPIRRVSQKDAIVLVVKNMMEKKLLSYSILRYFVTIARDFEEYELFKQILNILELPTFEKLKWQIFYKTLPLRLSVYKMKKMLQKI